ncbi:AbrB/MazE/SpoVT family DNA-binding domain-containing protein [Candidatus Woesearchaeota archaeon]|nr:AbrB/MazE/SpoVT family DNA-binding domain-containing protein [Candidatus Woesearchaeota archaeon]
MKAKFIGKAKLTKQGQLTLPLEARKDLRINNEDELYWYLIDNHLVVVKDLMSIEDLVKKLSKKKR